MLRDWLPKGHLAWFVLDAVAGMNLGEFPIARDLIVGSGDVRPLLAAASMTAASDTVRDGLEDDSVEPISLGRALGILDEVLEFPRGGLEALQRDR